MAYSEYLADRIRRVFKQKHVSFEEKKMMGGLCIMVKDKMCVGVMQEKLMARIAPEEYPLALKKKGCHEMTFTGRPLKGFVLVNPDGIDSERELEEWIQLCLDFNPLAKASKKKG